MPGSVAKIAVAAAKYWVDRPYDYLIPEELREKALPGSRVYVPFARGNRRSEGIILAVSDHSDYKRLKAITAVLDEKPVLTPEQIKTYKQKFQHAEILLGVKGNTPITLKVPARPKEAPPPKGRDQPMERG